MCIILNRNNIIIMTMFSSFSFLRLNVFFSLRFHTPQVKRSPPYVLQHQIHDAHLFVLAPRASLGALFNIRTVLSLFQLHSEHLIFFVLQLTAGVVLWDTQAKNRLICFHKLFPPLLHSVTTKNRHSLTPVDPRPSFSKMTI